MYVMPETLTVRRPFTANRVRYEPGQIIAATDLVHVRSADMLLSLRYVVPTPDPHSRRTKPHMPTPTAQSAIVRGQIIREGSSNIDGLSAPEPKPAPKRTKQTKPEQKPETDNDIQKIRDNFKKKTDGDPG